MPTGLGLRPGAKAPDEPPNPTGYAPPLDSTTCISSRRWLKAKAIIEAWARRLQSPAATRLTRTPDAE